MKVYVTGFAKPFVIEGYFLSKDDEELILFSGPLKKRIPHDRILYIEENIDEARLQYEKPTQKSKHSQPTVIEASKSSVVSVSGKSSPSEIQDALKKLQENRKNNKPTFTDYTRASQTEPKEIKLYDEDDLIPIEVNFNGAKVAKFNIEVPRAIMNGKYTPSLGKEIFSYTEIRNILSDGKAILDGIPEVKANKVFYSTKKTSTEETTQDKMKMVGTLMNAGNKLQGFTDILKNPKPDNTIFTSTDFSMPTSPFETLPTLTINEEETE